MNNIKPNTIMNNHYCTCTKHGLPVFMFKSVLLKTTSTIDSACFSLCTNILTTVPQLYTTIIVTTSSNEQICDTSLVAGVSVAVTAIITSIITAIVSSIITYWCCVKRTSSVPAEYEAPITTTVDVQSNAAYGHVSGGKIPSTAVYETVCEQIM